jgi:hypothetical protein
LLSGLLGVALLGGCSDSTGPGSSITIQDLAGDWEAGQFRFTSVANPSEFVDLIMLGGRATLTIATDGSYTLDITTPDDEAEVSTGFMAIESGVLLLTNDDAPGETVAFAMTLSEDELTLVTDEARFDFDEDGRLEPALLRLVLVRDVLVEPE